MQSVKIFLLKSERGTGKPIVISIENAGHTYLKNIKNLPSMSQRKQTMTKRSEPMGVWETRRAQRVSWLCQC